MSTLEDKARQLLLDAEGSGIAKVKKVNRPGAGVMTEITYGNGKRRFTTPEVEATIRASYGVITAAEVK